MNRVIKLLTCLMFVMLMFTVLVSVFATTGLGTNVSMPSGGSGGSVNTMTNAETAVDKIWGSVKLILQVVSLAVILGSGVKYMLASADQKADIKKSLGILIIGAVIVFGTTLVIDFITGTAGDLLQPR